MRLPLTTLCGTYSRRSVTITSNRLSPSRRWEDIRVWWAEHLAAQCKSGQSQVAYCRAQGLDPKYFTLWKSKLQATAVASAPRMVPVVARAAQSPVSAMPETAHGWSLGNGISLSGCIEQFFRALHEGGGRLEKGISLRGLRARRARRGDLLFTR